MSPRAPDAHRTRLTRFGAWLVDITTANAGAAVYGAVMIGVLFAAEDARHEGYPATLEAAVHELPVVEGALIPVLVLLLTWATGLTVASGVSLALWTAAATIVVLEVAAGWRSQQTTRGLWLQAGTGAAMGFALVGVKLVLH